MNKERLTKLAEKIAANYEYTTDDDKETQAWYDAAGFTGADLLAKAMIPADADSSTAEDALLDAAAEIACSQVGEIIDNQAAAEHAEWLACANKRDEVRAAVEAALGVRFTGRGPSVYAWYGDLKLRISDHYQVGGGGYSMESDERMGEADIEWVVETTGAEFHTAPTRIEIRNEVAFELRAVRQNA